MQITNQTTRITQATIIPSKITLTPTKTSLICPATTIKLTFETIIINQDQTGQTPKIIIRVVEDRKSEDGKVKRGGWEVVEIKRETVLRGGKGKGEVSEGGNWNEGEGVEVEGGGEESEGGDAERGGDREEERGENEPNTEKW